MDTSYSDIHSINFHQNTFFSNPVANHMHFGSTEHLSCRGLVISSRATQGQRGCATHARTLARCGSGGISKYTVGLDSALIEHSQIYFIDIPYAL